MQCSSLFLYRLCFKVFCLIWILQCLLFLSFSITWIFSFHPSTFSLRVSFAVRQISCRRNILGSCFSIQPTTLCLLTGAFSPLTHIYLLSFQTLFPSWFFVSFFSPSLSMWFYDFLLFLSLCSLLLGFCESIDVSDLWLF